jgi:hypothetical protein
LNEQLWQTTAIDHYQATGINAASVDEVVLGAISSRRTLGIAAAVANDVALSSWLVLQLNREVIESGLLIVESDVAILVKLARSCWRGLNLGRAGRRPTATRVKSTNFECCRYTAASEAVSAHRDRGRTLTTGDGTG